MRLVTTAALLFAALLPARLAAQGVPDAPRVVLRDVPFQVTVEGEAGAARSYEIRTASGSVLAQGFVEAGASERASGLVITSRADLPLTVRIGETVVEVAPTLTPGWYAILPPIVAIVFALVFREVISALFAGVWLGALAVAGFNPLKATWRVIDEFVVPSLANTADGHTQIIVFSLLLGGMVGVIAKNGGTMGIVEAVRPFARTARRGRIATWLAGMGIFFDDYANTLLVGNTMRPITDKLRVSREKLAYLVDSTAAPIAAIVPISTWVGYEISLIGEGLRIAADQNPAASDTLLAMNPFQIFVETIPYRFYPVLALYFAALVSFTKWDLGPMARAEKRAAEGRGLFRPGARLMTDTAAHVLEAKEGVRHRWWNAAAPVLTVVVVVLIGLFVTGRAGAGPDASLRDVFGAADPFVTLLWASLAGCLVAIGMSLAQRILTLDESVDALVSGMRAMLIAMLILALAWSLGSVTSEIGTALYLSQILAHRVVLHLVPVVVFVTAAAMSFATGTSWGTMAILLPLGIPVTVALGGAAGLAVDAPVHYTILLGTISSVLAGSIFGDHCSPISDTTILSSTASGCDHVDHVRTQLPYALLVAVVGMSWGDVPTAYGLSVWIALPGAMITLWVVLRVWGTAVEEVPIDVAPEPAPTPAPADP